MIDKGGDVHAKNVRGHLPIEFAIETNNRNKVRAFLRRCEGNLSSVVIEQSLQKMIIRCPTMSKKEVQKMTSLVLNRKTDIDSDSDGEEQNAESSNVFRPACQSCRASARITNEQNIQINILKAEIDLREGLYKPTSFTLACICLNKHT